MTSHPQDDATAEAAEWYARLHVEEATADDRLAFARWEAANPQNARAWKAVSRMSTALKRDTADRDDPALQALRTAVGRRTSTHRTRLGAVALAVGAIVVAAVGATAVGLVRNDTGAVATSQSHVSGAVGQRGVRLADGTIMTLDARSAVRATTSGGARSVMLDQGRAFFAVARDSDRPFVVTAAGNRVTALGTRFAVRITPHRFTVDLVEGRLQVEMPAIKRTTILTAGNQLTVKDGSVRIKTTGAFSAAGWRDGPLTGD